jgi:ketosteroid isomerase-like protein
MSADNVQLVRRWFDGLAQGDPSPDLCHPEILIRNWDESPIRGPYEGHHGLRQWWADFAEVFDDIRLELREIVDVDDERVVVAPHVVGRFRATGIDVDGPFGAIVTVRDGLIFSAIGYASPGRAKKAAGLPPPGAGG